jgi:PAS domain S-box-containing protein
MSDDLHSDSPPDGSVQASALPAPPSAYDANQRNKQKNDNDAFALLRMVHQAQQVFMRGAATTQEIFDSLLDALVQVTQSEYGFIGRVFLRKYDEYDEYDEHEEQNKPAEPTPYLKTFSITNIAWNDETQALYERYRDSGMEFHQLRSLYGHVLTSKAAYIANNPDTDPHRHGTPEGHPPIRSFLGIPIISNDTIIGMVGVANRQGGYTEDMVSFLEPLTTTCAVIIEALKEREERQDSQQALAAARETARLDEQYLRSLLDSQTNYVVRTDMHGNYTYVNKSFTERFGVSTELLGHSIMHTVHPDDAHKCYQAVEYCLNNRGSVAAIELRKPLSDGSYIDTEWEFLAIFNQHGEPQEIQCVGRDLTAQRKAEAERAKALQFLNETGEVARVGGWEYRVASRSLHWTHQTYRIYELPEDTELTVELAIQYYAPEYQETIHTAVEQCLRDGTPFNIRAQFRTAQGNLRWVRAIGRRECVGDTPIRVYGTFQDITEQALLREQVEQQLAALKASHLELEQRQNFLNAVLQTAPSTLYLYNLHTSQIQILHTSQHDAMTFGYHQEELRELGGRLYDGQTSHNDLMMMFVHPDDRVIIEQRNAELLSDTDNKVYEAQFRFKDAQGEWHWCLDRSIVFSRNADGTPVQVLSAATEITKLKRAEENIRRFNEELEAQVRLRTEELIALNKEKEALLHIAAHDLKNPLQGITLAAGIGRRYLEQGRIEKTLDLLASVEHIALNASNIIANFLNISAIESGAFTLSMQPVNITSLVADVIASFTLRAKEKDLSLSYVLPETTLLVTADEIALRQVLENLLSNAIKYSEHGKQITVRLLMQHQTEHSDHSLVRIEVEDEGPGISAEDQPKLFEKFVRLSTKATGGEHSTGLGLNIVKKLVDAMGGRVWCESEPNHGATFIVTFALLDRGNNTTPDSAK